MLVRGRVLTRATYLPLTWPTGWAEKNLLLVYSAGDEPIPGRWLTSARLGCSMSEAGREQPGTFSRLRGFHFQARRAPLNEADVARALRCWCCMGPAWGQAASD